MADSELLTLLSAEKTQAAALAAKSDEYTARMAAVDATAPDAKAQADAINSEREAWKTTANLAISDTRQQVQAYIKTLPPRIAAEENKNAIILLDETKSTLTTAKSAFETAKNSKNAEITAADPKSTVKSPEATNPSASDAASNNKVATAGIVGDTSQPEAVVIGGPSYQGSAGIGRGGQGGPTAAQLAAVVPPGAVPKQKLKAAVNIKSNRGVTSGVDLRVKIRVPNDYLIATSDISASALYELGGIIFPYTPSITFNQTANYTQQTPTHSNYAINFYKNSSVSNISITGEFTVQNEKDARVYLATVHLLRALTKMRFGTDSNAGAPPPVCRLDAYGMYMLSNVPVAISDFRNDLPNTVDYYTFGKGTDSVTSVPVKSTIAITCIPMYSRAEMQKFSVDGWLNQPSEFRNMGYL